MELGAEISQKVKKTIKKQLKTLGCYVDDELPEYIMVMIANKRTEEQMVDDLHLFLNDEAEKFVSWLTVVLSRIQKAMELPDIDAIVGDVEIENDHDSKKKPKKGKKEKISESEEENVKHDRKKVDEKRRTRGSKDREVEEKERSDKRSHNPERGDRHREKEVKENDRREKERKQRMDERVRREREREEEAKKLRLEREEEINKRRAARERRYQEEKEKREERKKKEKERDHHEEKENRERPRKHKETKKTHESRHSVDNDRHHRDDDDEDVDDEKRDNETAVRREAEHEAKRIENRPNRNPMEFVKQIAKDITDQITSNQPNASKDSGVETGGSQSMNTTNDTEILVDNESPKDDGNGDISRCENVSLQAVSQYDDVENETEKGDVESHRLKKEKHRRKSGSRSRSKSGTRHHRHSRSGNKQRKSPSAERRRRHHSHSRSRSKEKHDGRSRKNSEKRSSSRKDDSHAARLKNVSDDDSGKKRDSDKTKDNSESSKRRGRSGSPHQRSSHHNHKNNSEISNRRNSKDMTEEIEDEDEEPSKPSLSSQVQVFTDFKRKPSLSKHNQASSVLLKRAVTEVVNEKPDGEENEDDVELDYNETNDENDEFSDEPGANDEVMERRVINFDKEKSGLPTITVNFNQDSSKCDNDGKHRSRHDDRDRNRGDNEIRHKSRNHSSHSRSADKNVDHRYQNISKYDARYTILRSRLEHEGPTNDRKVHHHKHHNEKSKSNRDKNLSSMVADLEEKSRRHGDRGNWRDRRNSHDSSSRQRERAIESHRKHHRIADGSSADDEEAKHVKAVKERMVEMQESDEGDLRDLLVGKRERKSSSEDEESSARRLREKIKEEKHKILFGKLKPEERDRSKREREHLVEQLKTRSKRRRVTETKESPEWIEKVPEQNESNDFNDNGNEQNLFVENITDIDEDAKNDDEWEDSEQYELNGDEFVHEEVNEEEQDEDSHQHISQNDLEEVSDEELADESEKEIDQEENADDIDFETSGGSKEEVELVEMTKEGKDVEELEEEEEVEEVVEIEVEVSDTENLDGDDPISQNGSKIRENGGKMNDVVDLVDLDKNVSPTALKDSVHVESSEDSPFHDENDDRDNTTRNTEKYDRKSKQKSSKRKRMRHEFIVTLEGLGDGKKLSIETGGREKSPKIRRLPERQKSDRHRRHRHSRSQSDEEFEEILRRKEEEEKRNIEQSRIFDGRRSHRSRSQSSSEKESKHRELRVNREIMLAENKLKTQKVFKKCLETVQNVTNNLTVNSTINNLEQLTPKAAFINPNFQPKIPIEAINAAVAMIPANVVGTIKVITPAPNLNAKPIRHHLSVAEKNILQPAKNILQPAKNMLQPTVLTPSHDKLAVKPLRIERSKDFVLPSGALDIVALPHVDMSTLKTNLNKPNNVENQVGEKPAVPHSTKETPLSTESTTYAPSTTHTPSTANVVQLPLPVSTSALPTPVVSEESRSAVAPTQNKPTIQERCAYWPVCKNQSCPYIHPSVNCKLFPNCSYGQHCIYIHPPCMFGEGCSNATCPFMHVQPTPPTPFTGFSQICKFYPNCAKADCPFKHVTKKPCRYGASCNNPECPFSHDDVHPALPSSSLKWVAEKPHVSERKFAAAEAIVSHVPVTIVTSTS